MQYQALVDIVQLIDLLEKACIRFVHFSKENELRSRVFSEKMGIESGWNCHISLKSNDKISMRKTVSYHCPPRPGYQPGRKKSGKRAAVAARNNKLIGMFDEISVSFHEIFYIFYSNFRGKSA